MVRKRVYRCKLSVNQRLLLCDRKKASKECLKAGLFGTRCEYLKISLQIGGGSLYSKGHAGLTLLITSILMIPFGINETALILIFFSTGLSSLPDIDMSLRRYSKLLHHRGPTHSILFAFITGISFGLLLYYGYETLYGFEIGFITAFWGVISHLIGDMFTYHEFKPLWPFSNKEVALGLCSASDRSVNEGLISLGCVAFVFYLLYNEGILQEILQILL